MALSDLVIHESTMAQVQSFLQQLPHACIVVGPDHSGKLELARAVAESIIGDLREGQNYTTVTPDEKNTLSIDAIRGIKQFLSLKLPAQHNAGIHRAVLIKDAHTMRVEAQNALLKTLEEPPDDTIIILTTSRVDSLLPTIRSRAVELQVRPLSLDVFMEQFDEVDDAVIQKVYHLSQGYYALFHLLLSDDQHPLYEAIDEAKAILQKNTYQRLCLVSSLKEDKETLARIMHGLRQILQYTVHQAPTQRNIDRYALMERAESDLSLNVHPKIVLTELFLKM